MPTATDRQTIAEAALAAKLAAVVLLLGAALAVFGRPSWLRPPAATEPTVSPVTIETTDAGGSDADGRSIPGIDPQMLAESLGRFANAPKPPSSETGVDGNPNAGGQGAAQPGDDGATGSTSGDDADRQGSSEITFVGAVIGPDRRVAVLRIEGRQRWVAEGDRAGRFRVLEVTEGACVVEPEQGEPMLLERAERTGSVVTVLGTGGSETNDSPSAASRRGVEPDVRAGDTVNTMDIQEARRRRLEEMRARRQRLDAEENR